MVEPLSKEAQEFVLGKYRHYKGNEYQALFVARHTETHEEMVVYQDISDPEKVWCRPLLMFLEMIQTSEGIVPRFTRLN